ncbi:hypothetical protein PG994_009793 [Apiospora phragmitis]|uniref:Membrane-associated protein n=1 Tax=Apiospora phragmitis TaxID=2905665 RepID=A0ABR1U999_9PEZI
MNKILALLLVAIVTMAMGERALWVPRETGSVSPAAAAPAPAPPLLLRPPSPSPPPPPLSSSPPLPPPPPPTPGRIPRLAVGSPASLVTYPWTYNEGFACATNEAHVVRCASGTNSPLFSVCVDYSAVVAGSCDEANTAAGCCTYTDFPACGTYLWTGTPARSMYRCFPTTSVVTLLDEPQFVVDARTNTTSSAGGVAVSPAATPSTDVNAGGSGGWDKNTMMYVIITVGTILGFFLVLGLVRLAASFRNHFPGFPWFRRGGNDSNNNNSGIELVDLPPQQQQQQH